MRPDDGRVIPTFLSQALSDEDLTVYGDGSQTRSFCYVTDTVAGLRALMETDDLQGEAVNVGRQNELSILELAERILDSVETRSEIVHEQLPADDPERRCPDISKARRLLGWEPTVPLEQGLAETISNMRSEL